MKIMGLDLSLRNSGVAIVADDWGFDWGRVSVARVGYDLKSDASVRQQADRIAAIRDAVLELAARHEVTHAVREEYAFTASRSRAHALGELGGVVTLALLDAGVEVETVPPASARKLLGKAPRKDPKGWAAARLRAMGAPTLWSGDQIDAFVCANWKLAEIGVALVALEAA